MAKYCKKSYKPRRRCTKRRRKLGSSCKRPLKVKICKRKRKTFRTTSALKKKTSCLQKLGRTLKIRIEQDSPVDNAQALIDANFRIGFSHESLRDRIKTTLANSTALTVPVYGWNDIPQQMDFLRYFRRLKMKRFKLKWIPSPEFKPGIGIEHGGASGNVVKAVPGIGRMYVYETVDVMSDIGLSTDKVQSRAQTSFDPTKPFSITRNLARTYINPSLWAVMAHDRTVNAFMDPQKYIETDAAGVTGTIAGIAQVKNYGEAYAKKLARGFVCSLDCKNLPSQMRMGHWELEYSYVLDQMHQDNQDVKDNIQVSNFNVGDGTTALRVALNEKSLTALSILLGIGGAYSAADMMKSIPTMEAAYKGDIQTVALAAATAGGWGLLDVADLTAVSRHASTYFTQIINNLS